MSSVAPAPTPATASTEKARWKIPHLRWVIAFLLFAAAVLNYVDRSLLGLLAPSIQADLKISDSDYASIVNYFLIAYTIAYLLSGFVVDRLGVRLSFALFVTWWSISNALTGFAQSFRHLAIFRFMLGLGEAGGFTASPKATAEWFPPAERGIAVGIYSLGGAVGATLAPLLVSMIATTHGWRWVFAATPVLAGMWLIAWLAIYRSPSQHPRITEKELEHITKGQQAAAAATPAEPAADAASLGAWAAVKKIAGLPFVWKLMIARMLTDPVWYFYQFWMPKYLHSEHKVDQAGLSIMWLIFLAADIGFLASGFMSGRLIKKGTPPPKARLWVMLISACLVPVSFFVPAMHSVGMVIALGMLVAYAHTAWLGNLTSLVMDVAPKRILGGAFGVIACGSTLGGMFMNKGVVWFIDNLTFNHCFYVMAFAHPIALLIIWRVHKSAAKTTAAA
ncbi:MFS transporter [Novosphingobium sp.]|uniref:MFS transporter n=1 Tax=Novosphingobium sp. TaxID=1874826 RepID=UPI002619BB26|nr:MFS transporter [Novosphingobium sp.]